MPSDPTEHDQIDPCAGIQAQLAAYALGEIDADTDMLAHLSSCAGCQEDLRAYIQVGHMLAHTAPEVAPPPALRDRILAAVAQEQPAAAPAAPAPSVAPSAPQPARQTNATPAPEPRRGLFGFRPAFGFAFAALAFIALIGWNLALQSRVAAQSADLDEEHRSWQTMIGLLNNPSVGWYAVAGTEATGRFWAVPQGNVACLVVQGLPKLDSGHVYQVWLIHGQQRTNGGLFEAFNGNGWILIRSDKPMSEYDAVGVTVEPKGGSAGPTSAPVLRGDLTALKND